MINTPVLPGASFTVQHGKIWPNPAHTQQGYHSDSLLGQSQTVQAV